VDFDDLEAERFEYDGDQVRDVHVVVGHHRHRPSLALPPPRRS
jgi:hypothetical protein